MGAALVEHCPRASVDAQPILPSSRLVWHTARRSAHHQPQPPPQQECAAGRTVKPRPPVCPQTRAAVTRTVATVAVAFGVLRHLLCWSEFARLMSVLFIFDHSV